MPEPVLSVMYRSLKTSRLVIWLISGEDTDGYEATGRLYPGSFHPSRIIPLKNKKTHNQSLKHKLPINDFTQGIVEHHHMKVLVDVQGDAQDLLHGNASNLVGKGLSSLTPQVSVFFPAHGWYLLNMDVPAGQAGMGQTSCASPAFFNGLRPRRMMGRRYLITNRGGVNHPQNL